MKRAFVFDFDATIAPEQGRFDSKLVRQLLLKMQRMGFTNVMLTGRPLDYAIGTRGMDILDARACLDAAVGGYGTSVWHAKAHVMQNLTASIPPAVHSALRRVGIPNRVMFCDPTAILVKGRYGAIASRAIEDLNMWRVSQDLPPLAVVPKVSPFSTVFQGAPTSKDIAFDRVVVEMYGIAAEHVIGAGDSWESDGPFLAKCRYAVIPANGDPRLKAMPNAIVSKFSGPRGTVDGVERVLKLIELEDKSLVA